MNKIFIMISLAVVSITLTGVAYVRTSTSISFSDVYLQDNYTETIHIEDCSNLHSELIEGCDVDLDLDLIVSMTQEEENGNIVISTDFEVNGVEINAGGA